MTPAPLTELQDGVVHMATTEKFCAICLGAPGTWICGTCARRLYAAPSVYPHAVDPASMEIQRRRDGGDFHIGAATHRPGFDPTKRCPTCQASAGFHAANCTASEQTT